MSENFNYKLEGVPENLAEHVRSDAKLRHSLLGMGATAMRLIPLEGGWSDPRAGLKVDEAFEIQLLGRPGMEDDTRAGSWGKCYIEWKGNWCLVNISAL